MSCGQGTNWASAATCLPSRAEAPTEGSWLSTLTSAGVNPLRRRALTSMPCAAEPTLVEMTWLRRSLSVRAADPVGTTIWLSEPRRLYPVIATSSDLASGYWLVLDPLTRTE